MNLNFRYQQSTYLVLFVLVLFSGCSVIKVDTFESIIEKRSAKTYVLKEGKFNVSRPFVIPSGIKVIGNNTTLLINESHPFPIFQLESVKNVEISNISIEGKELIYSSDKDYLQKVNYFNAISIKGCNDVILRKIKFKNIEGTGIKALDSENINIQKCLFFDFGYATFKDVGYSSDAIYLGGGKSIKSIKIDSCIFDNIGMSFPQGQKDWPNDGDGIQILTDGFAEDIVISNCEFNKCSSRGIKVQNGNRVTIRNNIFKNSYSAVLIPMYKAVENITISKNKIYNTLIAFATDKPGTPIDINNLQIMDNTVDSCLYFFRTNGYSNVRNSKIEGNVIGSVGQFVVSGRFYNTNIINNVVDKFAIKNDPNWNMAILMSPESENVTIEGNRFGGKTNNKILIDNRSKNKITIRNNSFSTH